jgi:hypothetical protein
MAYIDKFPFERYGLTVRLVDLSDAEFILSLRTDSRLSRFISATDSSLDKQEKWIQEYKLREKSGKEYYFMFLANGERQGVARIYNIEDDHFTQGSWLFSPDAYMGASVLGNIISSEMGFELPNKKYLLTDARKGNTTHRYVKSFKPEIIGEDDIDVFYRLSKDNFDTYKLPHINFCSKQLKQETRL